MRSEAGGSEAQGEEEKLDEVVVISVTADPVPDNPVRPHDPEGAVTA